MLFSFLDFSARHGSEIRKQNYYLTLAEKSTSYGAL